LDDRRDTLRRNDPYPFGLTEDGYGLSPATLRFSIELPEQGIHVVKK
jgi:hypothetical protein